MKFKVPPDWAQIAGFHSEKNSDSGVVWLAFNKDGGEEIKVWHASVFKGEPSHYIAQVINEHGRRIPIAWEKSAEGIVEDLRNNGVTSFLRDGYEEDEILRERTARRIDAQNDARLMECDPFLKLWKDELKTFARIDGKVPEDGFPLMGATRHAIHNLRHSRPVNPNDPFFKPIGYSNAGIV